MLLLTMRHSPASLIISQSTSSLASCPDPKLTTEAPAKQNLPTCSGRGFGATSAARFNSAAVYQPQQSEAEACQDVLRTPKPVESNGSVLCSRQGNTLNAHDAIQHFSCTQEHIPFEATCCELPLSQPGKRKGWEVSATGAARRGIQLKRCQHLGSQQNCLYEPQQQSKENACQDVLGTAELIGSLCSRQGSMMLRMKALLLQA